MSPKHREQNERIFLIILFESLTFSISVFVTEAVVALLGAFSDGSHKPKAIGLCWQVVQLQGGEGEGRVWHPSSTASAH